MKRARSRLALYLAGLSLILGTSITYLATNAFAASSQQVKETSPIVRSSNEPISSGPIVGNDVCLGCHGQPGSSIALENGDVLDLYVDPDMYAGSIHGENGYACVQCHTNLGDYPHPPLSATDLRAVTLQLNQVCYRCHAGEYNKTLDSVHAAAQAVGTREAAVCTDCHGSHNVHQWTDQQTHALLPDARLNIPLTCSRCHFAIYQKYLTSVHGAALTEEANTDVPTCIDCHGVHNIENPTTNAFRLKSPELCAHCHTNPELMGKYGISTDVLNTYVADFHGTTVTLFEKQSPDAPTNKPVCFDCHGIHDISRVTDPKTGIEMQQNLLVRCKECHPDATDNFPSAWMSHYIPSAQHYSLVYYVNLFYKFFIPLVLGFMVVLVGLDVGHSMYVKTRKGRKPLVEHDAEEPKAKASAPSVENMPAPESGSPIENVPSAESESLVENIPFVESESPIEDQSTETPESTPEPTSDDSSGEEDSNG